MSDLANVEPFDPTTVKVGDEVLVRATIVDAERLSVRFGGHQAYMLTTDIVAGVIPAPEPPRRPDGWSADGKSVDPWHGVSAEERDRRCESARRAVEEAHRPKEEWRFCTHLDSQGVFAIHKNSGGHSIDCCGSMMVGHLYSDLVSKPLRKPLTADEAYRLLLDLGGAGAEEFCKLTGYVPPKQCEGWRFTSAIGAGCYGFHDDGRGFYYGLSDLWISPATPGTFSKAVDGNHRREITAAEAYEICKANGQGAKFCEITGYVP